MEKKQRVPLWLVSHRNYEYGYDEFYLYEYRVATCFNFLDLSFPSLLCCLFFYIIWIGERWIEA